MLGAHPSLFDEYWEDIPLVVKCILKDIWFFKQYRTAMKYFLKEEAITWTKSLFVDCCVNEFSY